jgi:AraC-like DNA-binding protein
MTTRQFIIDNKHLRVKDIAALAHCSPAYVCKILKPKAKVITMKHIFNIDKEAKKYGYV